MAVILWHTWEPGLDVDTNLKTSGGGAFWTKYLWKELEQQGHLMVISSPFKEKDDPRMRIELKDIKDVDLVILCWRWLLPSQYVERNKYYLNQAAIIAEAIGHNIPIIVHDQDHKIDPTDLALLLSHKNVVLTAPELFPREHFSTLMFPNPYRLNDWTNLDKVVDLTYVGNNYERYEQFKRFFGGSDFNGPVQVWGNWLEPSPNREAPEKVQADCPSVVFEGRLDQSRVISTLAKSKATIFLAKDSYCERGFVTIRFAEAVAANCPGFIPDEFKCDLHFGRVKSHEDLVNGLKGQTSEPRLKLMLQEQRRFVSEKMTCWGWLEKIEEALRMMKGWQP
jgi:hypothetical protein